MFTKLLKTNRIYWIATILTIAFFATQFYPIAENPNSVHPTHPSSTSKKQAIQLATQFAQTTFGIQVTAALPMYQTDAETMTAVIRKHAEKIYEKRAASKHPLEYYEVELNTSNGLYRIYVSYEQAEVVGWDQLKPSYTPANVKIAEQTLKKLGYSSYTQTSTLDKTVLTYDLHTQVAGMPLFAKIRTNDQFATDFKTYFRIPAKELNWQDKQENRRSNAEAVGTWASLMLLLVAVIGAIRYRKTLRFQRGWLFAGLVFCIQMISIWNLYPAMRLMVFSEDAHAWALSSMFSQAIFYLGYSGFIYLAFVVGDGLWRAYKADDLTYSYTHPYGLTYLLAFAMLAIQSAIYYFGDLLFEVWTVPDAWMALDNLQYPQLFPLHAWTAGISEEIVYRLFGTMIFFKLFSRFAKKNIAMFMAIFLSSMIWALGHVGYPVFPVFSRFVEVTLLGFAFSYIFLRYGLMMAILVHTIVDSFLMALSMKMLPDALQTVTGPIAAVYLLIPFIVATFMRHRHVRSSQMSENGTR